MYLSLKSLKCGDTIFIAGDQNITLFVFSYWFNAEMPIERGTTVVTPSY